MPRVALVRFAILILRVACLTAGGWFSLVCAAADTAPPIGDLSRESARQTGAFLHPGLLCNEKDFGRMKAMVDAGREPWKSDWEKLITNKHASLNWQPRPVAVVYRGKARGQTEPENYSLLFNDAAAAYSCALRWRISGDRFDRKAAPGIMAPTVVVTTSWDMER
jgi:hypothetical protein